VSQTTPVRARPANVAVLAILTVLALAIAPACAPLCAAKICSSGTGQGQCHEMASMGADGSERLIAPSRVCGASEFSAVLVKADAQSLLSQGLRNHPAQALINGPSAQSLGSLHVSPDRWDVHRVPIKSANSLLSTTILRF
jgi:hypothetical protein